ncbi:hypothetical protein A9Q90_02980 [Gammaproteobacteria bacterium 54_18_T64]|nr:hypothetical protein A9Q90_02980 [Gammaproteobacteria bacterium 54_18_T64]
MNKLSQATLALLPLLLTPVFAFLLAQGLLNLGAGEKDMLWAWVWALWSLIFALSGIFLIYHNNATGQWALRASYVAIGLVLALWLLALAASLLQIL